MRFIDSYYFSEMGKFLLVFTSNNMPFNKVNFIIWKKLCRTRNLIFLKIAHCQHWTGTRCRSQRATGFQTQGSFWKIDQTSKGRSVFFKVWISSFVLISIFLNVILSVDNFIFNNKIIAFNVKILGNIQMPMPKNLL